MFGGQTKDSESQWAMKGTMSYEGQVLELMDI